MQSKAKFRAANPAYGYGLVRSPTGKENEALVIDKVRHEEFAQLIGSQGYSHQRPIDDPRKVAQRASHHDEGSESGGDVVYLDHAGATLYAKSQLDAAFSMMKANVFGNPHTQGTVSQATRKFASTNRTRAASCVVLILFVLRIQRKI
jgi:hypothetical protein